MSEDIEIGPIDYVVIEFAGREVHGELAPELFRLIDEGYIHLLDLILIKKSADGKVSSVEVADADPSVGQLAKMVGESTASWSTTTSKQPPRPWNPTPAPC